MVLLAIVVADSLDYLQQHAWAEFNLRKERMAQLINRDY